MQNGKYGKGKQAKDLAARAGLAVALSTCFCAPAFALLGFGSPLTDLQKKAIQALKKPSDEPTLQLVEQIAHQPELMNLRYLQYVIGPPSNAASQFGYIKRYYWDDPSQQGLVKYELMQRESSPGQISESTLLVRMPNLDKVDLPSLESKYGIQGKKYFDQKASPNLQYSFAPDTKVSFKQPQDTFHVTEATVSYSGVGLPPLSAMSLSQAQQLHRTAALAQHKDGNWHQAIPALRDHVAENPDDAEARLALAEAYKGNCNLNEAIDQYGLHWRARKILKWLSNASKGFRICEYCRSRTRRCSSTKCNSSIKDNACASPTIPSPISSPHTAICNQCRERTARSAADGSLDDSAVVRCDSRILNSRQRRLSSRYQ